jgi:cytochrome P450
MTTATTLAYDPLAPEVQADPYPFYTALRREAPVHYLESWNSYAVSRHGDVRRVMHDAETFSSEAMANLVARPADYSVEGVDIGDEDTRNYATSIIGTDGDAHTRLRLIVNRGFTPKRISRVEEEIRRIAGGFVDELVAQGGGDLQAGLAVPLPTIVIAEMLGVPTDRRADFRRWSEHMVRAVFEPLDAEEQQEVARSGEEMGAWLDGVIASRPGYDGDDLISVLLRAESEGGALSHEELYGFAVTLLVAGSITTAYLIGTAVQELMFAPRWMHAARGDLALVPAIVEETLRHDAATQLMFRTATRDVVIADTTIPKGATVLPLLGSANRDGTVFPDPDDFDPGRDASEHLSLGHGVHFCLGAALARLEARVVLEELLTRTTCIEPAGDPTRITSIVFRGPTVLPVRVT